MWDFRVIEWDIWENEIDPLVNLENYGKIHHFEWENQVFQWPWVCLP